MNHYILIICFFMQTQCIDSKNLGLKLKNKLLELKKKANENNIFNGLIAVVSADLLINVLKATNKVDEKFLKLSQTKKNKILEDEITNIVYSIEIISFLFLIKELANLMNKSNPKQKFFSNFIRINSTND